MARKDEVARGKTYFFIFCICFLGAFVGGLSAGAGVDVFLAGVLGISILLLIGINTYVVVLWADPKDQSASYWLTALVVFALVVAEGAILGLPLDVANNQDIGCSAGTSTDVCGGLDMYIYWQVIGCLVFIMAVFCIPVAIFQYEAYTDESIRERRGTGNDNRQAFCVALCYEMFLLAIVFLTLGLMWNFLGTSEIPVTEYTATLSEMSDVTYVVTPSSVSAKDYYSVELTQSDKVAANTVSSKNSTIDLPCSFAIYILALTGFLGWFGFVVFGGVGIAAMPITLINNYIDRPKHMTREEVAGEKLRIQEKTAELIKLGTDMKQERAAWWSGSHNMWERRKQKREDRTNVNQLKQMVYILETELDTLLVCEGKAENYNPLYPFICLITGILCLIISLLWFLQIVLYMLVDPPVTPFLNAYFLALDDFFSLFGVLSVALFSFYLHACVIVGLFKVGVRFFCITLHPMRYGKTLMNSFLFNSSVIVLCAIPVVQFCTYAFDGYARYTTISTLLGVQVKYLKFLSLFFSNNIFVYILLVLAVLSSMYLTYYHRDTSAEAKQLKQKMSKMGKKGCC